MSSIASTQKQSRAKKKKTSTPVDVEILKCYPHLVDRIALVLDELRKTDPKNRNAFASAFFAVTNNVVAPADMGKVMSAVGSVLGKHRKKRLPEFADLFSFVGIPQGDSYLLIESRTHVMLTYRRQRDGTPILVAYTGQSHIGESMQQAALAFVMLQWLSIHGVCGKSITAGMHAVIPEGGLILIVSVSPVDIVLRLDKTDEYRFGRGKTAMPVIKEHRKLFGTAKVPLPVFNRLRAFAKAYLKDTATTNLF